MDSEKLKSIAKPLTTEERAQINYRIENADWLRMSATRALKIRKIMREFNISHTELATRLNLSPSNISELLSGKINFDLRTLSEIEKEINEIVLDKNAIK